MPDIDKRTQKAVEEMRAYYAAPFTTTEKAEIFKFLGTDYRTLSDGAIKKSVVDIAGTGKPVPRAVVKLLNKIFEKQKNQ